MAQYIDKDALVSEIDKRIKKYILFQQTPEMSDLQEELQNKIDCLNSIKGYIINTLEVKNPYEQYVQYDSIKTGIQAHAETYSFNVESKLFNQLTKEQQKLWRKEIEQACISGGDMGVELARDTRYKENLEVKENDLLTEEETEKELAESYINIFDKKFGNKLPNLKGKQLAEFKNFINTCEQTFYMKYFDYHATQGKLFEKLALLWAVWGKEHLGLEMKDVDLEKAGRNYADNEEYGDDVYLAIKAAFKAGAKWRSKKEQDIIETAEDHAFLAGANWQKEQMMKDAIPAKVVNDEYSGCVVDCDNGCLVMPRHAYNFTDKLKIIIVKE